MGQQQLILLVLATIIVGLAIVVGIRAFNENNIKSNADQMLQDAVRIGNDAQAWKQKPAPFGGQAALSAANAAIRDNFTGVTLELLGYSNNGGGECGGAGVGYGNLNGCYTLGLNGSSHLLITGTNAKLLNEIEVAVCGLSDLEVNGLVIDLGGTTIGTRPVACVPVVASP